MVLGIFYYPWYGGKGNKEVPYRHWKDGGHKPPHTWNSRYLPTISESEQVEERLYDSFDQETVNKQMELISQAGINFVVWSWWGNDTFSDHALSRFWESKTSNPSGLKHCIYYEKEWLDNVPIDEIKSDIDYIRSRYTGNNRTDNEKYFKLDNKDVVFVYNSTPIKYRSGISENYQSSLADKWFKIRMDKEIYTVLKVSNGWQDFKTKSNSWHQYGPSTHYGRIKEYSSYVSPGWWSPKEEIPRLERDVARFENDIRTMKSDGTPIKMVQTWNEWTEGTGIEPASFYQTRSDHGNIYIDIILKYF